jgi:hypothetical protein
VAKDDNFKAFNSRLNPGQFFVAEDNWRNIPERQNLRLQLVFMDLSSGSVQAVRN